MEVAVEFGWSDEDRRFREELRAFLERPCPTTGRRSRAAARERRPGRVLSELLRGARRARAGSPRAGPRSTAGADASAWRHAIISARRCGAGRAARLPVHERELDRPDDHEVRQRGPEARAPAADRRRRRPLVSGLLRARGRLGPGLAAHAGAARRRRLRRERHQDLDLVLSTTPSTASCWCAPIPTRAATAGSRCC